MHKRKFSESDNNDAVYDRPYNLMQFPFFVVALAKCVCYRVTDATTVGVTVSCLLLFFSSSFSLAL